MDLKSLQKAVNMTGFLAELEAGRCFVENNWDIKQNFYYFDSSEKKEREIDILATNTARPFDNKSYEILLSFFCDVKKITDNKAWVIFSTNRNRYDERYDYFKITSKLEVHTNKEIAKNILNYTQKYPRIGRTYSTISAEGKNEENQIFTAIKNSTKALKYYYNIEQRTGALINNQNIRNNIILKIMAPLIILKGSLYEIYLDDQNKECYEKTNSLIITYNYICENVISENYLIEIVTIDELNNFLKDKKQWLQSIANVYLIDLK